MNVTMNATTIAATALRSVLIERKISGQFLDAQRGPRTLSLAMRLTRTADLQAVLGLDEAIAMRAGLEQVRMARLRDRVLAEFELPRSAWRPVWLNDVQAAPGRLALGVDTLGRPATISLSEPETPHLLVAGTTGSGKTSLMRSLLAQTVAQGMQLQVIDTKAELTAFYGVAAGVYTDPDRAAARLQDIAHNLQAWGGHVIAIDEMAALVYQSTAAAGALGQIASLGRSLDVHLIAGTQRVDKTTLGNALITDNMARLAGRVSDARASLLATGQAAQAAHRLSGAGDFLLMQGDRSTRFIAAQAGDALDALPAIDPASVIDDASSEDNAQTVGGDWHAIGAILAAAANSGNNLSSRLVKDALGVTGTDRARRLRDQAAAVLAGIEAGGAGVFATMEDEEHG